MNIPEYYLIASIVFSSIVLLILFFYAPRMWAWFGAFKKSERLHNEKNNRLAILVPARDESSVIKPLLESLRGQIYRDFEVFVIVKDPADKTIEMTKEAGFRSLVVADQTCKSDALDGAVQMILSRDPNEFDAYIILDADTMIKEDYLLEMNNAMASGRDVIVSKKIVKNYFLGKGSLTFQGAANGYIWTLFDHMGNKYKSRHHIALFTVGSGLLISKKIILHNGGWCYKATLTEDCELAGDIIANHWSTYYAEYAPIYMEEAPTLDMTDKRRNRWMSGLTSAQRLYKQKDFSLGNIKDIYFSYSIFLTYVYFGILFGYLVGNTIAAFVYVIFFPAYLAYPLFSAVGALILIYGSFFVMALFAFFASFHDVKGHWAFRILTIFVVPFHYLGYFPIMVRVFLGHGPKKWEQISRVSDHEAIK